MSDEISEITKAPTGKEVGATGLVFTTAGLVEEEFLPQLAGRKAIQTYREMRDNDPVIGAIMFCIDMLVRQVDWRVDASDGGNQADADFLDQCMNDMSQSWGDFVSEVMSMLVFGFSYHEIVYKQRTGPEGNPGSRYKDNKIGWRKIPIRGQETLYRWEFGDDGTIQGFVQKAAPRYEEVIIPIEKSLLFRTTTFKNNPEGRSVLRNAYRPWFYKKRIENIEGVGIERDLAGLPLIGVDPTILHKNATDDDKAVLAAIQDIGKNIRRDKQEYILWPNVYDDRGNKVYTFDLIASRGTRQFDTNTIIGRYDQRITMTTLTDFLLLGHERVGSFALSSDKTDLFAVALGTFLDVIEDALNRYAVPRLFELNNMNLENLPEIKHGDIESPDLTELGAYITALTQAGVPLFPDNDLEDYLRDAAHLPEKSKEAEALQQQKQTAQQQQFGAQPGQQVQQPGQQDATRGPQNAPGSPQKVFPVPRGQTSGNGSKTPPQQAAQEAGIKQ